MDTLTAALLRYWGVSTFRPLQREAVLASLEVNAQTYPQASSELSSIRFLLASQI